MIFTARATSYDEVPYADDPYPQSHPGHLAVVATLAGLKPAPVGSGRVLEIGSRGGNLIPMAVGLPGSSFVGIEPSAGQVATARSIIEVLGLDNIAIECRSVLDVGADFGRFDYILCHGTYSWVAPDVQDGILEILARNLAPHGVAYLSYNTYPGWRLRELARELMTYHARRYDRPADRAREARLVLDFMAASAAPFDRTYASWLREESEQLKRKSDSALLHDQLEEYNEPVYFHEMIRRAAAKGLRFVSEVQASLVVPENLPAPALEVLRRLARDGIEFEQFVDFVVNRKFRQSVFCHDAMTTRAAANPDELVELELAARRPMEAAPVRFRDEPRLRAVLEHLASIWPSQVPWASLVNAADEDLASDLIGGYGLKLVELRTREPAFVTTIGERPAASPLARYQAAFGSHVINLRHEGGQLNESSRMVLRLLDGTRDRASILDVMRQSQERGRPVPGDEDLGPMLDRSLEKLARFALLTG